MLRVLNDSLKDFAFYRDRYRKQSLLTATAIKVLTCFKEQPETRLQRRMILEQTALPRTTVTDALKILTENGFIQRLGKGSAIRYQLIFNR